MDRCNVEPITCELFGRTLNIVRIKGRLYAQVEVWINNNESNSLKKFVTYLRTDNIRKPVPYFCYKLFSTFVIRMDNCSKFVFSNDDTQPNYILVSGDLILSEFSFSENISDLQIKRNEYYLNKCSDSSCKYSIVNV